MTREIRRKAQSGIHKPKRNTPGPEAKVLLLYWNLSKSIDMGDIKGGNHHVPLCLNLFDLNACVPSF